MEVPTRRTHLSRTTKLGVAVAASLVAIIALVGAKRMVTDPLEPITTYGPLACWPLDYAQTDSWYEVNMLLPPKGALVTPTRLQVLSSGASWTISFSPKTTRRSVYVAIWVMPNPDGGDFLVAQGDVPGGMIKRAVAGASPQTLTLRILPCIETGPVYVRPLAVSAIYEEQYFPATGGAEIVSRAVIPSNGFNMEEE